MRISRKRAIRPPCPSTGLAAGIEGADRGRHGGYRLWVERRSAAGTKFLLGSLQPTAWRLVAVSTAALGRERTPTELWGRATLTVVDVANEPGRGGFRYVPVVAGDPGSPAEHGAWR